MNAYSSLLRALLSSSILALAACGTSTLGGGGTGAGAGTGGGGTGGACTVTGDHNVSLAGLPTACTHDADCAAVYQGDGCATCTCPNAAIAASAMAAYSVQEAEKTTGCCLPPHGCNCIAISVSCVQGSCVLSTPGELCNGVPSPVSCAATSCPSGFTCTPDPDPTTCHPSHCSCDPSNGWACTADCGTNGSTCVKGL